MKNVVLSVSGLLLLAAQVNAQQPNITVSSSSVNETKSVSYAYTVNDVKNSTNVRYSSSSSGNNQDVQDDSPMRSKTFSKSFTIDRSDKVNLNNQYGSITIKTWNKNEIKVDTDIKAYAKTDKEAQKLLDDVVVTATKSGDLVAFKTTMGDRNGNWGSNVRNGKTIWRREVKTHYIVYMPASNALTVSQQYGNIIIDDFAGPTSLKVQYGNLTAGDLSNANNYISIQYGKGSVKDMGGASIKHQYGGGITVGNVLGNLDLNAQYTSVNIASVKGAASITHQYGGGTTIGSVSGGAMNVNTQYAPIKIGSLKANFTSRAQYGKVIIDDIEAGKDIDVDAQYSSVSLGFSTNYNGDLDVKTNYGSFNYGTNVTAKRQGDDGKSYNSYKRYSGQVGKGGSGRIIIDTQYGSVTFK
jgi:hypothetical protein